MHLKMTKVLKVVEFVKGAVMANGLGYKISPCVKVIATSLSVCYVVATILI